MYCRLFLCSGSLTEKRNNHVFLYFSYIKIDFQKHDILKIFLRKKNHDANHLKINHSALLKWSLNSPSLRARFPVTCTYSTFLTSYWPPLASCETLNHFPTKSYLSSVSIMGFILLRTWCRSWNSNTGYSSSEWRGGQSITVGPSLWRPF